VYTRPCQDAKMEISAKSRTDILSGFEVVRRHDDVGLSKQNSS